MKLPKIVAVLAISAFAFATPASVAVAQNTTSRTGLPGVILFIDLANVSPLRFYVDGELVFDGVIGGENPSHGLNMTMHLPLRGEHLFRLVAGAHDTSRTLNVTDTHRFVLLNGLGGGEQAITLANAPLLD